MNALWGFLQVLGLLALSGAAGIVIDRAVDGRWRRRTPALPDPPEVEPTDPEPEPWPSYAAVRPGFRRAVGGLRTCVMCDLTLDPWPPGSPKPEWRIAGYCSTACVRAAKLDRSWTTMEKVWR